MCLNHSWHNWWPDLWAPIGSSISELSIPGPRATGAAPGTPRAGHLHCFCAAGATVGIMACTMGPHPDATSRRRYRQDHAAGAIAGTIPPRYTFVPLRYQGVFTAACPVFSLPDIATCFWEQYGWNENLSSPRRLPFRHLFCLPFSKSLRASFYT